MRAIKTLSLLIAILTSLGMMVVAGVVAGDSTIAQPGASPGNNTTTVPLALVLESHIFYPNDVVRAYVYNATDPLVDIIDPAGASHYLAVLKVNDSAFMADYALDRSVMLANYTIVATDNATGEAVNDTFEVIARPVVATPAPNATIMPENGAIPQPYYLYLNLSQRDYMPPDKVEVRVVTNAGTPTAAIRDPAGNTADVELRNIRGDTYEGTYQLDKAVVLGSYAVSASVNGNGTYSSTTAYFNVTMGKSPEETLQIRYTAYDPAQRAIVVRANIGNATPDAASAVKNAPSLKGVEIKDVKVLPPCAIENGSGIKSPNDGGMQVEVVIPVDGNNTDPVTRQLNVTRGIVNATTSVAADAGGARIRLTLNDKIDGCWYRMSAAIPDGFTVQKIARDDGTEVRNGTRMDAATGECVDHDINRYMDNGTLYFYDDPATYYTILLSPDPVTITLYFHDNAGYCFLNTSMDNSSNDHTTLPENGGGFVWTQSQALASDLVIRDDPRVNIYVTSDSTSGNTIIDLRLSYVSGNTSTIIGSYDGYQFKYRGGGPQLQTIDFTNVPANTTIPAGSKLVVAINSHTGNKRIATVWESALYPSNLSFASRSYLSVVNVSVFNIAGFPINSTMPPSTVKVVANVTDPFGVQDIDGVALVMYDANGSLAIGPLPMMINGSSVPPSNGWAFFEADMPVSLDRISGNYTIVVTATSVDGITSNSSTMIQIDNAGTGVTAMKSIASSGGNDFMVTIEVSNNLGNTLSGVRVYDFYADDFIVSGFSRPRATFSINNGMLRGSINVFGPFTLSPYENITITYIASGAGDYRLLNMTIVGIDPRV